MSGRRRRRLWGRTIPDHDVAGLKLGLAQRLAEAAYAGTQLRRGHGAFRPDSHRRSLAAERYQRMDRTGRLDVEREPRPPNPFCPPDFAAAAVARDFELRDRGSLHRRERDFEIPSWRSWIETCAGNIDMVRQRRHLQQGLACNRGVGVAEQVVRNCWDRRTRCDRWRGNWLRRGQRPAKRRRWRVGMDSYVVVAFAFQCSRCR